MRDLTTFLTSILTTDLIICSSILEVRNICLWKWHLFLDAANEVLRFCFNGTSNPTKSGIMFAVLYHGVVVNSRA